MKTQKKSSKNAVTAGVLIALYFVTYLVIGAISMPVPVLFLLMPMLVALLAAPTYHMLLAKTKSTTAIVIAAILPSILLVATGHIPIAPLVAVPAGIILYVPRSYFLSGGTRNVPELCCQYSTRSGVCQGFQAL